MVERDSSNHLFQQITLIVLRKSSQQFTFGLGLQANDLESVQSGLTDVIDKDAFCILSQKEDIGIFATLGRLQQLKLNGNRKEKPF